VRIDIITIFPEYFGPLRVSLIGKAAERGDIQFGVHDLRGWSSDVHRSVDDAPYGGGPGMVMTPGPWGDALDSVLAAGSDADVTVIDPEKRITVDHATMGGGADWSPYQGWPLAGFAEHTFCRGKQIVDNYKCIGEKGWGKWLPRERAGAL